MLDFPLQLLLALGPVLVFWRRGNWPWVPLLKGVLLSLAVTILLSLFFWITS